VQSLFAAIPTCGLPALHYRPRRYFRNPMQPRRAHVERKNEKLPQQKIASLLDLDLKSVYIDGIIVGVDDSVFVNHLHSSIVLPVLSVLPFLPFSASPAQNSPTEDGICCRTCSPRRYNRQDSDGR
jgi:hypothetical protein